MACSDLPESGSGRLSIYGLIHSASLLSELDIGFDFPATIRRVTDNPAQAVGLNDRGVIEAGRMGPIC